MTEILYKTGTAPVEKKPPVKLVLIKALFEALHAQGIRYCHWKSNEHLAASMTADTDLDVLFDQTQQEELERLLQTLGFKKFDAVRQKQYKDIEDYIGLDEASGVIVHLHTHYRLTMGEAYLKSYQLNIEEKILDSRVFDDAFGLYRIAPVFELALLYFRAALKMRHRDVYRMRVYNETQCASNLLNEYRWLRLRTKNEDIAAVLKQIVHNYQPVYMLLTGDFNRVQLLKLSRLLKEELQHCRRFSPATALLLRWYREAAITSFRKIARWLHIPLIAQRINPRGGLVVAIIGADGSGKSTVIANLQATFRKKLDVYRVYLGNGRVGSKSWSRKALLGLKKIGSQSKPEPQSRNYEKSSGEKKGSFKANLFKCLQALVIAAERRKNLDRMQAAKKRGMLVLCDRFPQNQMPGYNDGPMLHAFIKSSNPLFRAMAKREAQVYARAQNQPPDLVIKLVADAQVIQIRKPSLASLNILEAKVDGIKKLQFAAGCHVVTVDATQPLERVLLRVKKELWARCP